MSPISFRASRQKTDPTPRRRCRRFYTFVRLASQTDRRLRKTAVESAASSWQRTVCSLLCGNRLLFVSRCGTGCTAPAASSEAFDSQKSVESRCKLFCLDELAVSSDRARGGSSLTQPLRQIGGAAGSVIGAAARLLIVMRRFV